MAEVGFKGTVGVVTPFKRQANRLRDALTDTLDEELRHTWALRVGTAHAFQGDERDVIVVSLCCSAEMSAGTRSFVTSSRNLFNVAVTRARAVLHVVGDRSWAREEGPDFIRRLAVGASAPQKPSATPAYESVWEERLDEALRDAGILTQPQYPVAGRRLDLAVVRPGLKLDIEVDGEAYHRRPDGTRKPDDLWRDHQLKGLGWRVKRFWVYQLREDMAGCISVVQKLLESSDEE